MIYFFVVSLFVGSSIPLVRFGQLLRCADKRIVNTCTSKETTLKWNYTCNWCVVVYCIQLVTQLRYADKCTYSPYSESGREWMHGWFVKLSPLSESDVVGKTVIGLQRRSRTR